MMLQLIVHSNGQSRQLAASGRTTKLRRARCRKKVPKQRAAVVAGRTHQPLDSHLDLHMFERSTVRNVAGPWFRAAVSSGRVGTRTLLTRHQLLWSTDRGPMAAGQVRLGRCCRSPHAPSAACCQHPAGQLLPLIRQRALFQLLWQAAS